MQFCARKRMSEPIIIKVNDLKKEGKTIIKHIEELIKTRNTLYKNNNFPICIATSVLIIEEIAKLHLIVQHMKTKKPIGKTEWESMYRHKQKLTKPIKGLIKKMKKLPLKELEKILNKEKPNSGSQLVELITFTQGMEPDILKTSKLFDKLKQDCFYVSQRRGRLFSISNNLTLNEQEKIAFWIQEHSQALFLGIMLYFNEKNGFKNFLKHQKKLVNKVYAKKHKSGHEIFEKYYWKD